MLKTKINYKKAVLVFILTMLFPAIYAQNINLLSFEHLKDDVSARLNQQVDVNGKKCAVVIIVSNIEDYEVEAKRGIEHSFDKTGEKYIWLSPDEYELVIRKKGYMPLSINLKDKLRSLETYKIVLSDDYGVIDISAPNAKIWINDRFMAEDKYLFREKTGEYTIKATRDKYYLQDERVFLHPGDSVKLHFDMNPIMGKLSLKAESYRFRGAKVYINEQLSKFETDAVIPLIIGEHNIKVEKDNYLPFSQIINVKENKTSQLLYSLTLDPRMELSEIKRKKFFLKTLKFASYGLSLGSLIYYFDYLDKTDDVESSEYKITEAVTAIGFLAGIFSPLLYQNKIDEYKQRQKKLEGQLTFNIAPIKDGAGIGLTYTF